MSTLERLAHGLALLLRTDERRVLVGEDVSDGGMLGLSRVAAADPELRPRLLGTPLVPAIALAHAGGLAFGGLRPIVLLPSAGGLVEGLAGLREAAALPFHTGGSVPLLVVAPTGPGFGLGADALEAPEAILARVPGLRVVVIGSAGEAAAMLTAAAEFWAGDEPTVLLLPRRYALEIVGDGEATPRLARPFSVPHRVRTGAAATVFAWGECVASCLLAIESAGLDVTLVDVECIAPLDRRVLVEEAGATGRIVIAHAGPGTYGIGAELAAMFADETVFHLDAPILRLSGTDARVPPYREHEATPAIGALAQAIARVAS